MVPCGSPSRRLDQPLTLTAGVFDVDGVLLRSPHERAWREALVGIADPERFTTALYCRPLSRVSRVLMALRAALQALGVKDIERQVAVYTERKQNRLETLIAAGSFFGIRGWRALRSGAGRAAMALGGHASSSKNASGMMRQIHLASDRSLLDIFEVDVCGRDVREGKPNPEIFELAAREMLIEAARCLVVEDAPAGIKAARAGNMAALGVARHGDAALLWAAGADLVVTSLDDVAIEELAAGREALPWRSASEGQGTMRHLLKASHDPAWVMWSLMVTIPLHESSLESPLRDQQRIPGCQRWACDNARCPLGCSSTHLCGRTFRHAGHRIHGAGTASRQRKTGCKCAHPVCLANRW